MLIPLALMSRPTVDKIKKEYLQVDKCHQIDKLEDDPVKSIKKLMKGLNNGLSIQLLEKNEKDYRASMQDLNLTMEIQEMQ